MTRSNDPTAQDERSVLVVGATGAQGGAVARALLAHGWRVRVLVRNTDSAAASALAQVGAEPFRGDLEDAPSLLDAMRGAYGVFSVQLPDSGQTDSERRHGYALIKAARLAGTTHFVHTSVAEADRHRQFPRWETGYWHQKYWTDKWEIEESVRQAGFERWTILRPAFLMDNFALPKARHMFPQLRQGRIVTALLPDTLMQLIAADDVGSFTCAAFERTLRFSGQNIDLAAEALTMDQVAAQVTRALGIDVAAESVSPEAAVAAGLHPGWVRSQEWTNAVGYRVDITALARFGIPLTSFSAWLIRHLEDLPLRAASVAPHPDPTET